MSNNGVRILIERRDGNGWYWTLNAYGEEYYCKRSEGVSCKGCREVRAHLTQIELSRHYKNQRTA